MTGLNFHEDTHEYRFNGIKVPSVTQILSGVGLVDFSHVDEETLKQASDFGTAVHKTTALYDRGELDVFTLDDSLLPRLNAWIKFREDIGFVPDPGWIERESYCEKYKFAGTPDRVGLIQGKDFTIVDIKTGVVTSAAAIQTAGYEFFCPFKVKRRMAVQLKEDASYRITEYKDKTDKLVFLSCLNVANFKRREGK